MGLMEVNGIRVHAYHGCLVEESRIGGNFRVDIAVEGDFTLAETGDRLTDTVDYGRVTAIVKAHMAIRANLIEHVAYRILCALKAEWQQPYSWTVRLTKERPPINGDVAEAVYIVRG